MLIIGMRGWKTQVEGETIVRREWNPGFFRRLFGRMFIEKMTVEGHPIVINRNEVILVELKTREVLAREEAEAAAMAQEEQKRTGPNPGRKPALWTPGQKRGN